MTKISYLELQKKYPRKLVALDRMERKVLAVGTSATAVLQKLNQLKVEPQECVLVGPIQKEGTINVYVSL